jgi:hypothetical protein
MARLKLYPEGLRPSDSLLAHSRGPDDPHSVREGRATARRKLSARDLHVSDRLSELRSSKFEVLSSLRPRSGRSGEYRARTGDLLVANQALSQLS